MKKKFFKYVLFYGLYVVFLIFCYNNYIVHAYGYYGFKSNPTSMSMLISVILLILSFIYIYKQKTNSYSKFIIYILFLINFIPSIIMFGLMPVSYKYLLLLILYWLTAIVSVNLFNKIHFKDNKKVFKSNIFNVYCIIIIELVIMMIVLFKYTGLNLNFDTVYALRENYFEARIPTILAYLYAAFKVVNPLFFVYLYNKKKKAATILTLIVQIIAFLCDGSKSTLFSIILAYIIVKYISKKNVVDFLENDKTKYYILFGLALLNVIGFIEFTIFNSSLLYNYFIRRLFFLPSLLNVYYFDFFSVNKVDFFRQSILGKLGFTSMYSMKIQNIIGAVYFNAPDMLANNGLFSDAYMNLGNIGVIILPIMICLALRFLDYSSKHIESYYLVTVLISVSYIFMSSSFFTVMMTHGYIILCLIILVIIPKDGKDNL